jgi:metallo-beta-lactamase family protein
MYFVRGRDESIALNAIQEPMVLISASGMLTGGRILHHLKHRVSDRRNTVLFVGFQPPGSRGDWLKQGNSSLRLFGEEVSVGAEIAEISGLSAHGDRDDLLRWCRSCPGTPTNVGVVHGEPESARSFAATLRSELGWSTFVAAYKESITV